MAKSDFRTDRNNNPTAFTTDLAKQALDLKTDYVQGDVFPSGLYWTAKIVGDPLDVTIKLIDKVGFYTKYGDKRWTYVGIPDFVWKGLNRATKVKVIGFMYAHEGGMAMQGLFK